MPSLLESNNKTEATFEPVATQARHVLRTSPNSISTGQASSQPSESQVSAIFALEAVSDAVVVLNADGDIVLSNRRFYEFFAISLGTINGRKLECLRRVLEPRFVSLAASEQFWKGAFDGSAVSRSLELEITTPVLRYLEFRQSVVGGFHMLAWTDVTEKKNLSSLLYQAQRVQEVGKLAAGIAHDFNNLLMAVGGNVALIRDQLASGEAKDVPSLLSIISQAVTDGKELVKQLLGLVRRSEPSIQPVDLRAVIKEVRSLLKHSVSPLIKVETQLPENLWPVRADASGLKQVLMNLCVNAVDAMKGRPESSLTISVANHPKPLVLLAGSEAPVSCVSLQVADNGPGISEEIRQQIFKPFFTTKAAGKGTGLGLAICKDIVEKLGGRIMCDSEPGKGALFTILLPRAPEDTVPVTSLPFKEGTVTPAEKPSGLERILVVDDDMLVRTVTAKLLSRAGYKVFMANDGVEAIEWATKDGNKADIVLLDISMPRLSGIETMHELRKLKPGMPIVLCSGLLTTSDPAAPVRDFNDSPNATISKPFEIAELTRIMRAVLDTRSR